MSKLSEVGVSLKEFFLVTSRKNLNASNSGFTVTWQVFNILKWVFDVYAFFHKPNKNIFTTTNLLYSTYKMILHLLGLAGVVIAIPLILGVLSITSFIDSLINFGEFLLNVLHVFTLSHIEQKEYFWKRAKISLQSFWETSFTNLLSVLSMIFYPISKIGWTVVGVWCVYLFLRNSGSMFKSGKQFIYEEVLNREEKEPVPLPPRLMTTRIYGQLFTTRYEKKRWIRETKVVEKTEPLTEEQARLRREQMAFLRKKHTYSSNALPLTPSKNKLFFSERHHVARVLNYAELKERIRFHRTRIGNHIMKSTIRNNALDILFHQDKRRKKQEALDDLDSIIDQIYFFQLSGRMDDGTQKFITLKTKGSGYGQANKSVNFSSFSKESDLVVDCIEQYMLDQYGDGFFKSTFHTVGQIHSFFESAYGWGREKTAAVWQEKIDARLLQLQEKYQEKWTDHQTLQVQSLNWLKDFLNHVEQFFNRPSDQLENVLKLNFAGNDPVQLSLEFKRKGESLKVSLRNEANRGKVIEYDFSNHEERRKLTDALIAQVQYSYSILDENHRIKEGIFGLSGKGGVSASLSSDDETAALIKGVMCWFRRKDCSKWIENARNNRLLTTMSP